MNNIHSVYILAQYKSKHRLIAEKIHYNIFCLLRKAVGNDIAYNMASGYCEVFEREVK